MNVQKRISVLASFVALLSLGCAPGSAENPAGAEGKAGGRPIVLVGLDGADWLAIDPLIKSGALPVFARLEAAGRTAVMVSPPPLLSPILWTTIATGMPPERHGILDFMVDLPDGSQAPVGTANRMVPALWNLFSLDGRRVGVIGWWATWPAEDVGGTVVADAVAPQLVRSAAGLDASTIRPEEARRRLTPLVVTAQKIGHEDLAAYIPLTKQEYEAARRNIEQSSTRFYDDRVAHLATIVASTRTYTALALDVLRVERPDFLAVYLEGIDSISHLFISDARRGHLAIAQAYRDADTLIGQLAKASPPDTLIFVCSDHGFHPATAGIIQDPSNLTGPATAWHRPYGIVAVATAGTLAGGPTSEVAAGFNRPPSADARSPEQTPITPLDLAPTLLHAAGLSVIREMPGRVVTALLPHEATSREVRRTPAPRWVPASQAAGTRTDAGEVLGRLRALGYVGATSTSLARQNLGEILYRRGNLAGAERELRAVLKTQPTNLTAMLWLAKTLTAQARTADALDVYEQAMRVPDGARDALVEAVDLAVSSGRLDRARVLIAAASGARAPAAVMAVARGDIAAGAGQRLIAERRYTEALRAEPASFDAAARLLESLVKDGRPGDALAIVELAAEQAPDSARHLALVGEARLALRDAAGAEAAFGRALQLAPDGDVVRLDLARAQLMQGKPKVAISTLDDAAPSAERDALRGAAYAAEDQWSASATAFQSAIDRGMSTAEVLNGLGWAQLKMGHVEQAMNAFGRSLAIKPEQPEIHKLVAELRSAPPASRAR